MSPACVHVGIVGGVATVRIDNPPVNAFAQPVRAALLDALENCGADPHVRAVVITGAADTFVAGADIREFDQPPRDPVLVDVLSRLESMPKPVVACIDGYALGGGLELAMACHYRIATRRSRLGLPEVKLGLLPGAGGTQRLPRLIGSERALAIMLSGEPVDAVRAHELGLVDELLAAGDIGPVDAARHRALQLVEHGSSLRRTGALPPGALLTAACERALIERYADSVRGLLSGPRIVECVQVAASRPFDEGISFARRAFEECRVSAGSRALRHLFFAERAASRLPGTPRPQGRCAVLGTGLLARGLEEELRGAGVTVTRLASNEVSSAAGSDLVIEALDAGAPEVRAAFDALDPLLTKDAVLATTTPYLRPEDLVASPVRKASIIGFAPVGPEHGRGAVEVVASAQTSHDALASGIALARRIRRQPVPVNVAAGLIGARMRAALRAAGRSDLAPSFPGDENLSEAELHGLASEGEALVAGGLARTADDIDVLCTHGYGFPRHLGGPMWFAAERRRALAGGEVHQ